MIFSGGKDGSKGLMKRITSTFSIKKNQNTTTNDPKPVFPRSRSTGASYESMRLRQGKKALPDVTAKTKRTKSACVSPQRRRDESRKHIDDIDSIWLTSDSSSSLLGERKVSVSFHFSLDESIVSWLSNAAKNQEDTTKENHQKSSKDAKPLSSRIPESKNKTCPRESCQEKTTSLNRYASLELTSQSLEEKKVSFSLASEVSPPSPVSSAAITIPASALEKVTEIGGSKRKTAVEPLFWPFEQKFDWTTDDIMKHFSMSPQRKKYIGSKSASTSPRSMRAQLLHTRKLDLKEGCKRKLMFNGPAGSISKLTQIPELEQTEISNDQQQPILKRNNSFPSRLRNSSEISSKVVPIEATEDISREEKTPKKLVMTRKSRTFLEDDFRLMNDFSIENAVGLCEFRGREGIDSDFNTDGFLFEDSL
ncbi:hypothetical protein N665_0243s0024 [Sinapis alba]|nr:hypothetical protein N665_0243s0024 [Sinapis alba]